MVDLKKLKAELSENLAQLELPPLPDLKDVGEPTPEAVAERAEFERARDFRPAKTLEAALELHDAVKFDSVVGIEEEHRGLEPGETVEEALARRTELVKERAHMVNLSAWDVAVCNLLNTVVREEDVFKGSPSVILTKDALGCVAFEDLKDLDADGKLYLQLGLPDKVTPQVRTSLESLFKEGTTTRMALDRLFNPYQPRTFVLFNEKVTPSDVANARRAD